MVSFIATISGEYYGRNTNPSSKQADSWYSRSIVYLCQRLFMFQRNISQMQVLIEHRIL